MLAYAVIFCILYLLATEYVSAQKSKGEVLIYQRKQMPKVKAADEESPATTVDRTVEMKTFDRLKSTSVKVQQHLSMFLWDNLKYQVNTKNGHLEILKDVEGWVQGGTLTALMVCLLPSTSTNKSEE